MSRGLPSPMLADLQAGLLRPLLDRALADATLLLSIRDAALNLYYRGGSLLQVARSAAGYTARFDRRYFQGAAVALPAARIDSAADLGAWLRLVPTLKDAMDLYLGAHPKEEREVQQRLARTNNRSAVSRATDLYVCDIEYACPHGRFDFVGVHWPSTPAARKVTTGRRLVLGEVKHGDGALTGAAGLAAHVRDVDAFLSDPARAMALRQEMVGVFNQLRGLGLLDVGKDLTGFSTAPPLLLLVLANHDPDKTALRRELAALPAPAHCEIAVAEASFVGYGLFETGWRTLPEVLA